ncbi:hypothetical protein LTR74_000782 [Friedmanniomyces endolithicus]|nr:hypothetical protein LTR74_000782 [Friedmanniomyces endolithicus]
MYRLERVTKVKKKVYDVLGRREMGAPAYQTPVRPAFGRDACGEDNKGVLAKLCGAESLSKTQKVFRWILSRPNRCEYQQAERSLMPISPFAVSAAVHALSEKSKLDGTVIRWGRPKDGRQRSLYI